MAYVRGLSAALVLTILLAVPATAEVGGFIENESRFGTDPKLGQLHLFVQGSIPDSSTKLGWWAWAFVSDDYSNAYPGLSYQPADWLSVGVGVGMESGENRFRVGSFLWTGTGRWSLLVLHETGTSKPWIRAVGNADVGVFGVGGMFDSIFGIGPRGEIRIGDPELQTMLWGAALMTGDGTPSILVGVRLKFE